MRLPADLLSVMESNKDIIFYWSDSFDDGNWLAMSKRGDLKGKDKTLSGLLSGFNRELELEF